MSASTDLAVMLNLCIEECDKLRELNAELLAALRLSVDAMRAPLDDWKGVVERKALDAANPAIARAEAIK